MERLQRAILGPRQSGCEDARGQGRRKNGVTVKGSAGFLERVKQTFKAVYGPVAIEVDDDIDGDGDGADDYNSIWSLVSNLYWDLSAAWGIFDDEARSVAVKCAIDNFLESLDKMRMPEEKAQAQKADRLIKAMIAVAAFKTASEAEEKAGKRHSKTDQDTINAARDAHAKTTKALANASKSAEMIGDALAKLGSTMSDDDDDTKATAVVDQSLESPAFTVGEPNRKGIASTIEAKAKSRKPPTPRSPRS